MTTPAIQLATSAPVLAPTLASLSPDAQSAFAVLFGADGDAAGSIAPKRHGDATTGNALPSDTTADGELGDVVPPAMLAWLLSPMPLVPSAYAPTAKAASAGTAPTPMVTAAQTVAPDALTPNAKPSLPTASSAGMADAIIAPSSAPATAAPGSDTSAPMSAEATMVPIAPGPAGSTRGETPASGALGRTVAIPSEMPVTPPPAAVSLAPRDVVAAAGVIEQAAALIAPTALRAIASLAERTVASPEQAPGREPGMPARIAPAPQLATPVLADAPAPAAPAGRVFAAAIHQLVAPLQHDDADRSAPDQAIGMPGAAAQTPSAVAAPAAAAETRLNMADRHWPEGMIARITALRDASDALAATASIDRDRATVRLSPDALGTVEVTLHRENDQVRVHLAAEQPRAQALLADAQPRLTELAEARGIRVVHAGASMAGGDAGHASQQHAQASLPLAASRTNRTADEAASTSSDDRIA